MIAVEAAIAQDREVRSARAELRMLRRRYLDLTPRERGVLPLVVSGLLNKQAAAELGTSEVTLQIHRRNVMPKMAEIGRAHVCTPVTNAHLVCRPLLEQKTDLYFSVNILTN